MKKQLAILLTAGVIAAGALAWAQDQDTATNARKSTASATPLATQEAMVSTVRDSFVVVEYTLQYDKGDAPEGSRGYDENNGEQLIKEERPLQQPGLLIDGTHVVTPDIQLHPRFIKEIKVRRVSPEGKAQPAVSAVIASYAKAQPAVTLELAAAIPGAKPAVFDAQRPSPYSIVQYVQDEGRWIFKLVPFQGALAVIRGKSVFAEEAGLVVDKAGVAVGVSSATEMPADGWKGDPAQWPAVTAADMDKLLASVEGQAARGIVRVMLNFRSPKSGASQGMDGMMGGPSDNSTVQQALGVAVDAHTLLVLAELKPKVTARLERIRVYTDPPMDAKFKATLQDFAAFVVETDQPITGAPAFSTTDFLDLRSAALPTGEIYLQGEKRVAYFQPRRIDRFGIGWRGNLFPQLFQDTTNLFLFDPDGKLLAVPLAQREKPSVSDSQRYGSRDDRLTPVALLAPVLSNLKEHSDPNNVPLSEEQENRLAWVGVELQAMSQELARANNVSDQTKDGETGGLVTFVYPGSPAAKAGVEPGWILLRVDVEGQPKPIEVQVEGDRFGGQPFPWDRLDEASEAVFDRIPTPWPSVESPLVRTLTDLGFGKKYVAEFSHDGKIDKKDFTVVQGPASYDSAPKYKLDAMGLTVRDMTYEVRRYLQKKDDDPGVVISKIELGSKASSAGLKPYEVITHVNDQPVNNVGDFARLSKDQTVLRLSVKRMSAGRIVRVALPAAGGGAAGESAASRPN